MKNGSNAKNSKLLLEADTAKEDEPNQNNTVRYQNSKLTIALERKEYLLAHEERSQNL